MSFILLYLMQSAGVVCKFLLQFRVSLPWLRFVLTVALPGLSATEFPGFSAN